MEEFITFEELIEARNDARLNMVEAWHRQAQTTAEEGYDLAAAQAAIAEALAAQERYYQLCSMVEEEIKTQIEKIDDEGNFYFYPPQWSGW